MKKIKILALFLGGSLCSVSQTVTIEGTIRVNRNWTEIETSDIEGEAGDDGVISRVIFEDNQRSIVSPQAGSNFYEIEVAKTAATTPEKYVQLGANTAAISKLILTQGILNLNANSMTIRNSADDGITFQDGTGIFAETHPSNVDILGGVPGPGYGYVRWLISDQSNEYIVPFVTSSGADVRLQYEITTEGSPEGQINFSTYGTPNNNKPWAEGVTHFDAGGSDGSAKVADRYYIIEQGSYGTKPQGWLTFKYLVSELDAGLVESRLAAQRFNNFENSWGDWLYSPSANTGSKTVSVFLANPKDYFDAWVLSDQANPLPIELVSFEAKQNDAQVDLSWTTASEINSDFFTIQRTADGVSFEDIIEVKAAGHSNNYLNYTATDYKPYTGVSYYRLKNTDLDGTFELSELKAVHFLKVAGERSIEIFPNPNKGDMFNLELKGFSKEEPILVVIQDMAGRQYYSKITYVDNDRFIKMIDNEANLSSGVYLVVASSSNNVYSKKMIVE